MAAAVTLDMMEQALAPGQPAIRTMPNTPLSVGQGVVGLAAGTHSSGLGAVARVCPRPSFVAKAPHSNRAV